MQYQDFNKTLDVWKKCVEYALANYELDENKNKKLLPKENQEFLLKYSKIPSQGLISAYQGIQSHYEWSDERKEYEYFLLLKTIVGDSNSTNSLAIERMMVHFFDERINLLLNDVLPKCDKNTLILAHHTEYINYIYNRVLEKYPNRHILY